VKGDLREVDDDPVGIGERECPQIDLAREVEDESGLGIVAAKANVGCPRDGLCGRSLSPGNASPFGAPRLAHQGRECTADQ
jgi:hypothetical protein